MERVDLADDYDDFMLVGAEPPEDVEYDDEPPVIDDEHVADRILRRIGRLQREATRVKDWVAGEIQHLRAFESDRTAGPLREVGRLERSLEAWIQGQPEKVLTVTLPNGQIRRRKPRAKVMILDESDQAVAEVEKVAPAVIQTKPTIRKSAVADELIVGPVVEGAVADEPGYEVHAAVTADGEVVPHVVFLEPSGEATSFGYTVR